MNILYPKTLLSLSVAMFLTACGGGGGSGHDVTDGGGTNPTTPTNPTNPTTPAVYKLTLQVNGLPEGASLPITIGSETTELTSGSASLTREGNNQTVQLGKIALTSQHPYLIQCGFGELANGASQQIDGSVQFALTSNLEQIVQCQQKIFTVVEPTQYVQLQTRHELLIANLDGTQSERILPEEMRINSTDNNSQAALLDNKIYLGAVDQFNSLSGIELRVTDGTAAGTKIVKDINPLQDKDIGISSNPSNLTVFGDLLYFTANDDSISGQSYLYQSDGTAEGTQRVLLNGSPFLIPGQFTQIEEKFFFRSQDKVYVISTPGAEPVDLGITDGHILSTSGQKLFVTASSGMKNWLTDGTPGNASSFDLATGIPFEYKGSLYAYGWKSMADIEDAIINNTPPPLRQIWRTNANGENPVSIFNHINPNGDPIFGNPSIFGDKLIFTAYNEVSGIEFWESDGTDAGTKLLKDAVPGPNGLDPQITRKVGDRLVFLSSEGDSSSGVYYLWVTDGTAAGTHRLGSGEAGHRTKHTKLIQAGPDRVLFTIHEGAAPSDKGVLWVTDGTNEGTKPLTDKDGKPVQVYDPPNYAL